MIPRKVIVGPRARQDLFEIAIWIAEAASLGTAQRYVAKVDEHLKGFDLAAQRGTARNDVRTGIRVVGYRRQLTIAFTVDDDVVTIVRIFRAGEDWESDLADR